MLRRECNSIGLLCCIQCVRGVAVAIPILLVAFAVVAVSVVTIPVVAPVMFPEKLVAVTIPVVKMLS